MIDKFDVSIGNNSVIYFKNLDVDLRTRCVRLGADNNILELDIIYADNTIQSGNCVLCADIKEKTINLPSYSNLKKTYTTPFFTEGEMDYSYAADFQILFDKKDLNIVIDNLDKIAMYTETNRMVFYFDKNFNLINIRIKDLTPEEYNFLKTEELTPGAYISDAYYEKDEYREYESKYLNNIDLYDSKYDIDSEEKNIKSR